MLYLDRSSAEFGGEFCVPHCTSMLTIFIHEHLKYACCKGSKIYIKNCNIIDLHSLICALLYYGA